MWVLGHEHNIPWLQAMPLVELTLNATVNDSTQMSPAYISYGHLLCLFIDCPDVMLHVEAAQQQATGWV